MKKGLKLLVLALSAVLCAVILAGCTSGSKSLAKVSDLTFDFTTGDYTFSGVENADEYRVRIFPMVADEDGNMTESELPINESNSLRGGKDSYSGNVPLWSLTAGDTYHVYVLAKSDEYGDSTSDAVSGQYVAKYETVDDGVSATYEGSRITVDFGDAITSDSFNAGASYLVTLYKDGAEVDSVTVTTAEVTEQESTGGGSEGGGGSGFGGGASYLAEARFDVEDDPTQYTVRLTIVSNDEFHITSDESADFAVTEPLPEEEGNAGGEEGDAGSGDEGESSAPEESSAAEGAEGDAGSGDEGGDSGSGSEGDSSNGN